MGGEGGRGERTKGGRNCRMIFPNIPDFTMRAGTVRSLIGRSSYDFITFSGSVIRRKLAGNGYACSLEKNVLITEEDNEWNWLNKKKNWHKNVIEPEAIKVKRINCLYSSRNVKEENSKRTLQGSIKAKMLLVLCMLLKKQEYIWLSITKWLETYKGIREVAKITVKKIKFIIHILQCKILQIITTWTFYRSDFNFLSLQRVRPLYSFTFINREILWPQKDYSPTWT